MIDEHTTTSDPAVGSTRLVRRWKFRVEGFNDDGGYVGAAGQLDEDCEYAGTNAEAAAEADRRADAWERATGDLCARVTYESQGVISPNEIGQR